MAVTPNATLQRRGCVDFAQKYDAHDSEAEGNGSTVSLRHMKLRSRRVRCAACAVVPCSAAHPIRTYLKSATRDCCVDFVPPRDRSVDRTGTADV